MLEYQDTYFTIQTKVRDDLDILKSDGFFYVH